jgi:hypothetical protein
MTAQGRGVAIIRGLHTVIYGVMAASTLILLYIGTTGRHAAWLWGAEALLAIEVAVLLGNGFKCPLTAVVDRYAGGPGRVPDTFLPEGLTRRTLWIFGPMLTLALLLLAARQIGLLAGV